MPLFNPPEESITLPTPYPTETPIPSNISTEDLLKSLDSSSTDFVDKSLDDIEKELDQMQ